MLQLSLYIQFRSYMFFVCFQSSSFPSSNLPSFKGFSHNFFYRLYTFMNVSKIVDRSYLRTRFPSACLTLISSLFSSDMRKFGLFTYFQMLQKIIRQPNWMHGNFHIYKYTCTLRIVYLLSDWVKKERAQTAHKRKHSCLQNWSISFVRCKNFFFHNNTTFFMYPNG